MNAVEEVVALLDNAKNLGNRTQCFDNFCKQPPVTVISMKYEIEDVAYIVWCCATCSAWVLSRYGNNHGWSINENTNIKTR
jgi:hypothetical protein